MEEMKLHVHSDIEMRLLKSGLELRSLAGVIKRKIGGTKVKTTKTIFHSLWSP